MFECSGVPRTVMVTTAGIAAMLEALGRLDLDVSDAERVDQLRLLEALKGAAAAAQARVTTAFVASQENAQVDAGVRPDAVGKGIASQVALAKRESPARARRCVGWAGVLTRELPGTLAALTRGAISKWRAQIVARETSWLSVHHRRAIDEEIAAQLEEWGDHRVEAEVKKRAYRLDPYGYLNRCAGAEKDRRVSVRPAPDTMSFVTGYLPVAQGVALFAALSRAASSQKATGDARSRNQIMADTLVERVTGQVRAEAVPAEVNLVTADQAMFDAGPAADEPAHLEGFGPVPAELARRLLRAADGAAEVWVRRLYTSPRDRGAGGPGLQATGLRRRLTHAPGGARPAVPDAVVRRADPAR